MDANDARPSTSCVAQATATSTHQCMPPFKTLRASTGDAWRSGVSAVPSSAARACRKQSVFAGKTTPDCADSVQMCEVIVTEFGSSKAPREIALYCGHRSNVSDTVDPQCAQKWT